MKELKLDTMSLTSRGLNQMLETLHINFFKLQKKAIDVE